MIFPDWQSLQRGGGRSPPPPPSILGSNAPAALRIDNWKCALCKAWEENKTSLPAHLKWQIDLGQWHKPF